MKTDAERESTAHSCCGAHNHDQIINHSATQSRQPRKKYFCPMCGSVESDAPGSCPRCGMTLEPNPAVLEPKKVIYTCPMHPQIQQDHAGNCPICGMTLEPKTIGAGNEK